MYVFVSLDCQDKIEECDVLNITIGFCMNPEQAKATCRYFCNFCPVGKDLLYNVNVQRRIANFETLKITKLRLTKEYKLTFVGPICK